MTGAGLEDIALRLDDAAVNVRPTGQITLSQPQFSVGEAYEVQRLLVARRLQRGDRRAGYKMGLTSRQDAAVRCF
jgi:2-oxo-3-hexenedioate decarboxylase